MAGLSDPWAYPKYEGPKVPKSMIPKDQRPQYRAWRAVAGNRNFGSAGVTPTHNSAWQSDTGFRRWKAKHPNSTYEFGYQDLDGDNIPEAVVWGDSKHEQPVGVNGRGVKKSKAKFYMADDWDDGDGNMTNFWKASATQHGKYRDEWFSGTDTKKATERQFGKDVVKVVYDRILPDTEENAGKRQAAPPSALYSAVAMRLVGDDLDREFLERFGAQYNVSQMNDEDVRKFLKSAHKSKVWKTEYTRRLGTIFHAGDPQHPRHKDAENAVAAAIEHLAPLYAARPSTIRKEAARAAAREEAARHVGG
jgi:hypothetical protein